MKLFITTIFILFSTFAYGNKDIQDNKNTSSGAGQLLKYVLGNKNKVGIDNGWYSENLYGKQQIYGCTVNFVKIHTNNNQPDYISFIFSNKGDNIHSEKNTAFVLMKEKSKVKKNIKRESQNLQNSLYSSLGKYNIIRFGTGKVEERAYLWDSKNFYYILSAPDNEYVNLKIISKSIVDKRGNLYTISAKVDKKSLIQNVKRTANGNVVIEEYELYPGEFGIEYSNIGDIAGKGPEENAHILEGIFKGEICGHKKNIIVINSAAAILVGGRADNWRDAIDIATETIDSGKALEKLKQLIRFTKHE